MVRPLTMMFPSASTLMTNSRNSVLIGAAELANGSAIFISRSDWWKVVATRKKISSRNTMSISGVISIDTPVSGSFVLINTVGSFVLVRRYGSCRHGGSGDPSIAAFLRFLRGL